VHSLNHLMSGIKARASSSPVERKLAPYVSRISQSRTQPLRSVLPFPSAGFLTQPYALVGTRDSKVRSESGGSTGYAEMELKHEKEITHPPLAAN
jgi:hypothetical protein